jgi:hypothetical protein
VVEKIKSMMSISVVWYTAKIHFFCFSWKTVCAIFIHNSNNNNEGTNRKNSVFFVLSPLFFSEKSLAVFQIHPQAVEGPNGEQRKEGENEGGTEGGTLTDAADAPPDATCSRFVQ